MLKRRSERAPACTMWRGAARGAASSLDKRCLEMASAPRALAEQCVAFAHARAGRPALQQALQDQASYMFM